MFSHTVDGPALRSTRERRGFSVPALARKVGASSQHLYRIEWGRRQPSPALYHALLTALDLPEGALLRADAPPSRAALASAPRSQGSAR
ncbi:helix-turn-helix domain-containing protein [Nocardiopsis baichengensis]|uniref:helix-turn-helix domain-containing protein n=1 Tax=Nocardiopsis baichengensis TaxID=280240 RepID=UPI00034519F9|nr:helix-turn-helix transcriptional regulator [Nocardiopsis baichengensis]